MATYFQWKARHPEKKLLYYICGPEYAMVQEVKDAVIAQWQNSIVTTSLDCKRHAFASIEGSVLSSVGGEMFVLENCQVFNDSQWTKVIDWVHAIIAGKFPVLLVLVTNEEKPDTNLARFRPFVDKGRFVECKAVTQEALEKYCCDDYNLSVDNARLLISLCGFSFRKLNNELEKLALVCNGAPAGDDIRALVVFSAGDTIIRDLLERNQTQAKLNVHSVGVSEISNILRQLLVKLLFTYQAYKEDKPGIGAHRLAAIVGCQPWQLLEFFAIKRHWSVGSLEQHLKMLVEFEAMWSKNQTNVLPLLVQYW